MNTELRELITEATAWLERQPDAPPQSEVWYAQNNLRSFLASLERDDSSEGVWRAVKALKHQISDQFDWDADYSKHIAEFAERAYHIGRALASLS